MGKYQLDCGGATTLTKPVLLCSFYETEDGQGSSDDSESEDEAISVPSIGR